VTKLTQRHQHFLAIHDIMNY